jgi:hypothetical protein
LDTTRREVRDAIVNFDISDDKVLELRETARRDFEELQDFDRQAAKKARSALSNSGEPRHIQSGRTSRGRDSQTKSPAERRAPNVQAHDSHAMFSEGLSD